MIDFVKALVHSIAALCVSEQGQVEGEGVG